MTHARYALALALALVAAHEARPFAQPTRPTVVAIRGGTVLTVTRGTIQNGTVVLRDGKIAAVGGPGTTVPAGAEIVEAQGRFVTPGIIDAHSHIAAESINEGGITVSSMTGIEDVLNPRDINIYRDLAGGLTTANILHGSANPIGGKNQVIKLRWGKNAEGLKFEGAMPGIKFALGENPKRLRQYGPNGPRRYPLTRPGVEFVVRDAFSRAKAYQRDWRDYERRKSRLRQGSGAQEAGEDISMPRRDLQLEPLVEILEGRRLVHSHAYRADETLMLMRLAEEMGFKIATFQHVLEGYKVADEMAKHGAGGSTFSDWWAYKVEAEDAIPYNAAMMHKRGVLVSINSDSAEHSRRLNTEAAKSMHWGGVTEEEALAFVTINPAKQLRIDARVGSLEAGKDADVVIWNKHPLSTYAIVDRVYIDGQQYYDRPAEERRLTDAEREKGTLIAAEGRPAAPPTPQTPQSAEETFGSVAPAAALASQPTPAGGQAAVAITNARIFPISGPTIERGTLVIRGNRIEALGAAVAVPAGAQVIDAKGGEVYPGFIDARTSVGLNEPGPRGFDDANEMLEINAAVKAQVAYQADSDAIPVARVNGITTVAVVPSGGLVGGQVAVMNLDGWTWEEATLKAVAGVSFQFPPLVRGGPGGGADATRKFEDLKKERDARVQRVEDLVARARSYSKTPVADRATDWNLAAMVPVAEGKQPLFIAANADRDIREAVAFADRAGVKIVIMGGLEAPLVASLLKARNIPVVLGSVLALPAREDAHHAATYRAAGELAQAGVLFAFGTDGADNNRLLPYEAAISVAWGLDRNRALRAMTLDAATILGVADRVGSLEVGKVANFFIANGDPMEMRTQFTHIFINGRSVGLKSKHTELYDRFSSRPGAQR